MFEYTEDTVMKVLVEKKGAICTIIMNRPDNRNAVDRETADTTCHGLRRF